MGPTPQDVVVRTPILSKYCNKKINKQFISDATHRNCWKINTSTIFHFRVNLILILYFRLAQTFTKKIFFKLQLMPLEIQQQHKTKRNNREKQSSRNVLCKKINYL